eukprot:Gb_41744 [translate_table: standard]
MRLHKPCSQSQWPFSTWGLDLIGKINPSSSDGHKHIITATEYFTKWVEAIPLTIVTGKQISKFILNHLICRYGIPSIIITDNGKSFKNKKSELFVMSFISSINGPHRITLKAMAKPKHLTKL